LCSLIFKKESTILVFSVIYYVKAIIENCSIGESFMQTPDFDSIKQMSPYDAEFWSARDLMPLLGYGNKWQNFDAAIKRAMISCEQSGENADDQFTGVSKLIDAGKGAKRPVQDYLLSRFACYLVAHKTVIHASQR